MTGPPGSFQEILVSPDVIETPPQVRLEGNPGYAEPVLRELGHSLQKQQLSAIGVRRNQEKVGLYYAVYGFRRLLAAKLVKMATIRVIVLEDGLTESQIKMMQLIENMQRADLTGYEKWTACNELLLLNSTWNNADLANALNLDASMITRITSASRTVPSVQEAYKSGLVGMTDVYAISRVPESEQLNLLAAKLNGASRDHLESVARKAKAGKGPSVKVTSLKIALAGDIQVIVKSKDMDLETGAEALADALKHVKRAIAEQLDAKTAQAVWRDRAKAEGDQ